MKRKLILGFGLRVSLLAKASNTNCKLSGLLGVSLRRLSVNPKRRAEVKTNCPFNRGSTDASRDMVRFKQGALLLVLYIEVFYYQPVEPFEVDMAYPNGYT